MERKLQVWMLVLLPAVVWTASPMADLETIAGRLVFYQMEGNATYVRDTGELASDTPTEATFELHDPHKNFSKTNFSYIWNLGNGKVIKGNQPVVRYHYSESGNYTVRLKLGANMTNSAEISVVYSRDVQVLDAVKNVKMKGQPNYAVSQDASLAFHVDGSPPMWVCWRFLQNCAPDSSEGCTLTMLYDNSLQLNHTFTTAGVQCLDMSVRNDISKLQTSFSLYVRRNYNANLLFILSCAAVLVATFSFIVVIACRPRQQKRSQVASSSNAAFLKDQDADGQSKIVLSVSAVENGEREPLISQHGPQYST